MELRTYIHMSCCAVLYVSVSVPPRPDHGGPTIRQDRTGPDQTRTRPDQTQNQNQNQTKTQTFPGPKFFPDTIFLHYSESQYYSCGFVRSKLTSSGLYDTATWCSCFIICFYIFFLSDEHNDFLCF